MNAPALAGMHHYKIPVADLDASLAWYERVFDAKHLEAIDHTDSAGIRYAVILDVPGLPFPVELRWAPTAARALRQCDLLSLAVDTDDQLEQWSHHLDSLHVEHSPVLQGAGGSLIVLADPDGKYVRLMGVAAGGPETLSAQVKNVDPEGPWLNPAPMRRPVQT